MGGSAATNKPKPNKLQVGSGGYNQLSNNINCSITQYPPCANQNIPSETPPVDAQTHQENMPDGLKISEIFAPL